MTLAGSGAATSVNGVGTAASMYQCHGVTVDSTGVVFVSQMEGKIRRISTSGVLLKI